MNGGISPKFLFIFINCRHLMSSSWVLLLLDPAKEKSLAPTIRPEKRWMSHFFIYMQTTWNGDLSVLSLHLWVTEISLRIGRTLEVIAWSSSVIHNFYNNYSNIPRVLSGCVAPFQKNKETLSFQPSQIEESEYCGDDADNRTSTPSLISVCTPDTT